MVDELKERKALEVGARAQQLLDNPLLVDIFETLEAEYIKKWTYGMTVADTAGRERLWQAVQVVTRVREHLKILAADGRLSAAQLADLAQGAIIKPKD